MAYRLTEFSKDALKSDNTLMADVADALNVSVSSLPAMITRNNRRLTDISVLILISKKTKTKTEKLIEEYAEDKIIAAAK